MTSFPSDERSQDATSSFPPFFSNTNLYFTPVSLFFKTVTFSSVSAAPEYGVLAFDTVSYPSISISGISPVGICT